MFCRIDWTRAFRVLAATAFVVGVAASAAAEGTLTLWLTPLDGERFAAGKRVPTAEDRDSFFDDVQGFFEKQYGEQLSPHLLIDASIRRKAAQDPAFAAQVLGQHVVLTELSRFLEDARIGYRGTIKVSFFDWEELLGILDGAPTDLGGEADIVVAPSTWISHLADTGALRPIDSFDKTAYLPRAFESCEVKSGFLNRESKVYALPWIVDVRLLFFRHDMFPRRSTFDTLDEFQAALKEERHGATPSFAIPTSADWELLHVFSMFLWGSGGDWVGKNELLPRGSATRVTAELKALSDAGLVSFPRVLRGSLEDEFMEGKLASVLSGPWMIRRFRDELLNDWSTKFGVALPPFNVGHQHVTFLGGQHLGLTSTGVARPEALALLKYLTLEGSNRLGREQVAIPASRSGFRAWENALPQNTAVRELLQEDLKPGKAYPAIPQWASLIEAQTTRNEFYQLFKHIGDGRSQAVLDVDITELRDRLNDALYIRPRNEKLRLTAVVIGALVLWPAVHLSRQALAKRRLDRALVKVEAEDRARREYRNQMTVPTTRPTVEYQSISRVLEDAALLIDQQNEPGATNLKDPRSGEQP